MIPTIYFIIRLLDRKWRLSHKNPEFIFDCASVRHKMKALS